MFPALPDPVDPFYYLANFERALASLDARCADLFDDTERRFVSGFGTLPRAARALLVRMLMRKGPYFRASRLRYDEIGCPLAAAAPLVEAGWVDAAPTLDFDTLAPLVTKDGLLTLAAQLGLALAARASRAAMLDALGAAAPGPRAWQAWFPDSADAVLQLAVAAPCERLRLMFFGNLQQDWSAFVLADLGVYRYEPVPFDAASRAFRQRADLDTWLALRDCRDALDAALGGTAARARGLAGHRVDTERTARRAGRPDGAEPAALTGPRDLTAGADIAAPPASPTACAALAAALDTLDALAPHSGSNPWLRARHDKVRHAAGLAAERVGAPALAWRAYLACTHPESRYRRVRVLEQLGRRDEALALAQTIAAAPANEEEAQRAARTLGRLQRRRDAGASVGAGAARSAAFATAELVLPAAPAPLRVEEAARRALSETHAPVFYVENTLINSLFGLLCWPALFAPLPGAFFHPFQRGPADLHAADFVARRAGRFAACLAELETGAYRATIERRFVDKAGIQSPFVAWPTLDETLLALALDCFPAAHLRLWFERLLSDPGANRSGLPDLVRFRPRERRYELIEVKGPGDRLQDNQRRWLHYCAGHGLPVSVLQVRWAPDPATGAHECARPHPGSAANTAPPTVPPPRETTDTA